VSPVVTIVGTVTDTATSTAVESPPSVATKCIVVTAVGVHEYDQVVPTTVASKSFTVCPASE
jgi:hypothetical protein